MSQPKYIKGIPIKEYNRLQRKKFGKEYYRKAVAKHRAKDIEYTKFQWRMYRRIRRSRIASNRIEKYIKKEDIHNWFTKNCGICFEKIDGDYHIDHIIPVSKGGHHCSKNLQLAHPYCNQSKFTAIITNQNGVDRAV